MKYFQNPVPFFSCIFALLAFSCQQEKKEDTPSFSLEIIDSIRVEYAGLLDLMDADPARKRVLLHDRQRGIILLTDFEGNHVLKLDKQGDDKGSYGGYLWSPARIKDNDHISLVSHMGFFEFDAEGKLASHRKFQEDVPFFGGRAAADSELMEHEGIFYQKGLVARGQYNKTQDEYYDQFQLLVKFDPEKGSAERIIHLEEESPFRTSGKAFEIPEMSPSFTILEDKLLVIAGTDPHLNVYDIKAPHRLLERKPIAYPDYNAGQGIERTRADPKSIAYDESAGRTHTLKVYKDYLLSSFSPGYDFADRERYLTIDNREDYSAFREAIADKYPPALFLMDHQGEGIQKLSLPESLDHRQFLVRDGYLWWLSRFNSEVEEDFVKIYKVEITEME
ncbi:hypothetical protein [Cyclobacterium jeungdonense]|uniref:DUF4221 domain-containing protein n=1 Tax=Cyclobacterium jeungdonense TaxID=708087 RepID=A0ABT8C865_9BACT|nr:hypothetical protein [Cyclobacterium jeungdonense]MDN3688715.1 hypothetical protein [Cyclobacterium jeungdonense]